MYQMDHAARSLGVVVDEIEPGRASVSMTVRGDMVNSHDICHGGMIFSLADCAFAYSCNSRNRKTVAAGATIDFIRAARLGDRLTAVAEERVLTGRRADRLLPWPLTPGVRRRIGGGRWLEGRRIERGVEIN
jgi:acyl-CoA thioesterase